MTPQDLYTIVGSVLGVGLTLAALIVGLIAWLQADMKHGQTRLEDRLLAVEKEQARTSGLLEGLGLKVAFRSRS